MNEQDMTLARRLLTDLYATYYPAMYFKNLENMSVSGGSASQKFLTTDLWHQAFDTIERELSSNEMLRELNISFLNVGAYAKLTRTEWWGKSLYIGIN